MTWKGKEYEPRDPDVRYWKKRFGLKQSRIPRILTKRACEMLEGCADDAARRLMLGIGERKKVCSASQTSKAKGAKVAA